MTMPQTAISLEKLVRRKILNRRWDGLRQEFTWGDAALPIQNAIRQAMKDYEMGQQ